MEDKTQDEQEGNPQANEGLEESVDQAMADVQASLDEMTQEAKVAGSDTATAEGMVGELECSSEDNGKIQLLGDVDLDVMIELGRTEMYVEDVLKLAEGSVVELDKLAGDPVDVYVNQRLIARGEVLVLNNNFCIRISEIVDDLKEQAEAAAGQSPPV